MSWNLFQDGLHGENAHVDPLSAIEGLDWRLAGEKQKGSPHTIFQILNHLIFWQDLVLAYLQRGTPDVPKHAEDSWPGKSKPSDQEEWQKTVSRFREGLEGAEKETGKDLTATGFEIGEQGTTRGDLLSTIITHNSYHTGQIVLIRRQLGAWPPPSGGDTW